MGHCADIRVFWKGNSFFAVVDVQQILDVAISIWAVAKEHLIEHDSAGPNIRLASVDIVVEHLRSHVKRRAQGGLSEVISALESFAEAEVRQLEVS